MQKTYKAILFDLGGVLIDIDYAATQTAFEQLGVTDFKGHYTQFAQKELFDRFECGQIAGQHFINLLLPLTNPGTSANQVVAAWNAMIGEFAVQKLRLLEQLKDEYPLFVLSNTNELHWVKVTSQFQKISLQPLASYFKKCYLSQEIGKRKPHAETFLWVCDQMGFEPSEVLFIDDSPQHIAGADKAGLQTHYYQNKSDFYALFS